MAELTYRDAVIRGIAQEMKRDEDVVFLGEDIAKAGGVFKATVGLYEQFGPKRVRDTPISEQAILGAAMGAAMTGLKPIAEIMFSDFFAVCFDYIANEFPKSRYMTNGQTKCPLVVRTGNGAGSRFGAQHSQSVENWCMMIPGLKVVQPYTAADAKGLLKAAIRDPNPVVFLEHEMMYGLEFDVPEVEDYVLRIGGWQIRNAGTIGGNIANGSPIGEMPPLLIALGARIVLRHGDARREMALEDYFIAYGRQDRRPGEFLETIIIPRKGDAIIAAYKLSKRVAADISAVGAGFRLTVADGRITEVTFSSSGA